MGGSGTLVDGVRRWFQRHNFTNNNSNNTSSNNHNKHNSNSNKKSDHGSSSSVSESSNNQQEEGQLQIVEDFDFSGLKLIRVPKRNHLPIGPMEAIKKVYFSLLFFY